MIRKCRVCKEIKSLKEFYNLNKALYGKSYLCSECHKAKCSEYYWNNLESISKRHQDYYSKNKERLRAYQREYKKKRKDLSNEKAKTGNG